MKLFSKNPLKQIAPEHKKAAQSALALICDRSLHEIWNELEAMPREGARRTPFQEHGDHLRILYALAGWTGARSPLDGQGLRCLLEEYEPSVNAIIEKYAAVCDSPYAGRKAQKFPSLGAAILFLRAVVETETVPNVSDWQADYNKSLSRLRANAANRFDKTIHITGAVVFVINIFSIVALLLIGILALTGGIEEPSKPLIITFAIEIVTHAVSSTLLQNYDRRTERKIRLI